MQEGGNEKYGLIDSQYDNIIAQVRIIALSTLKNFWKQHPEYTDAQEPRLAWYRHTLSADWSHGCEARLQ